MEKSLNVYCPVIACKIFLKVLIFYRVYLDFMLSIYPKVNSSILRGWTTDQNVGERRE